MLKDEGEELTVLGHLEKTLSHMLSDPHDLPPTVHTNITDRPLDVSHKKKKESKIQYPFKPNPKINKHFVQNWTATATQIERGRGAMRADYRSISLFGRYM